MFRLGLLLSLGAALFLNADQKMCGAVPDLVLSAGAFVHGRDGNAVVLDPESAAWSAEWDL